MSEARGLYQHDVIPSHLGTGCDKRCLACAYYAGRASRDGLRKVLEETLERDDISNSLWRRIRTIVEADGEGE